MRTIEGKLEKVVKGPQDCERAFAVPGSDNIIDVINPETGRSWYYDQTLEQMREREPNVEIVDCEQFWAAKAKRHDSPIVWTETTEEQYWEMLEVLPPACMKDGGFLVGEPWDHHAGTGQPRFAAYRQWWGKTFHTANRPMTRKEFLIEMERSRSGSPRISGVAR